MTSGLASVTKSDIEAQVVSDEMSMTGSFTCSDTTLNTVCRNA